MTPKYPYPYLECGVHGEKRIGYVVCSHVLGDSARWILYERPTVNEAGLVLCGVCARRWRWRDKTIGDDLTTVCGACLIEQHIIGALPPEFA
jgi:hypothetical protein